MQIFFCEVCGHRVSDVEIEKGVARKIDDTIWCPKCMKHAPPMPRTSPRPHKPSTGRRMGPATGSQHPHVEHSAHGRQHHPESIVRSDNRTTTALLAAAVGISVGALIVIIAVLSRDSSPRTQTPMGGVQAPRSSGSTIASANVGRAEPVRTPVRRGNESDQSYFARIAFEAVERYASDNRDDIAGIAARYESVKGNYSGTAMAIEAGERARRLRADNPEAFVVRRAPAPTPTPERTPIAAAIPLRTDPLHDCPPIVRDVTIDGELSDWPALPITCREPEQIGHTKESWSGEKDSWYRFGVGYDRRALYIAVEVRDDVFVEGVDTDPWNQDGIEIRIDARPDPERSLARGEQEFENHILIAAMPGAAVSGTRTHQPDKFPEGTEVACVRTASGHITEVALPIEYLTERQGVDWDRFRLNIAVDDYDIKARDGTDAAQLWWKPDWRYGDNYAGSGTFARRAVLTKMARAPSLDGELDDWGDLVAVGPPLGVIDKDSQFCNGDLEKWTGTEDLSAKIYAGWIDESIYVAVDVVDETFIADPEGKGPWSYDSVEIFIDGRKREDQESSTYSPGCYQLAIGPGDTKYDRPKMLTLPDGTVPGLFESKAQRTPKGYVVETRIDLSTKHFSVGGWRPGRPIKLSVIVNDKDENPEVPNREYCFGWAFSGGGANFQDTSGWKLMTLGR